MIVLSEGNQKTCAHRRETWDCSRSHARARKFTHIAWLLCTAQQQIRGQTEVDDGGGARTLMTRGREGEEGLAASMRGWSRRSREREEG